MLLLMVMVMLMVNLHSAVVWMMVMSVGASRESRIADEDVREWGVFGLDCAFDKVKLFDVRARGLIEADLMVPEDKQRPQRYKRAAKMPRSLLN
ncbi:hypothetical protein M5D96_008201 [Drosophila gunungcola]|uniref:Secreted protein n=1 Tax=Drosophila gunungcola TaxID=103775 RepID=A0A9P9YM53_9MUSC|nr:hypothetical protein M5D96_008201 [Drosophila gunungcola]